MTEAITFPDEVALSISGYYFKTIDNPEAVEYCNALNAFYEKAKNGTLYIKFIDGDRKGSIARFTLNPEYRYKPAEVVHKYHSRWDAELQYEISNYYLFGTAKWDKRKNSCQVHIPSRDIVILPNYTGPTVYQMFDRKAAKEELIKNPDQHDIDGKLLSVGDKVLYINARYGSGFVLCHGTIKEFKVSADSKGHSFTTIVKNDDGDEESSISYPTQMIWKK